MGYTQNDMRMGNCLMGLREPVVALFTGVVKGLLRRQGTNTEISIGFSVRTEIPSTSTFSLAFPFYRRTSYSMA